MDNPYSPVMRRKSGGSPPIKNKFQVELDAKLKDRKSRGLSVASPTSDLDEVDNQLDSEDELLTQFNLTSKKSNIRPGSAKGLRSSPLMHQKDSRLSPGSAGRFPSPNSRQSPGPDQLGTPRGGSGRSPLDELFGKKSPRYEGGGGENIDMMATMRPGLKGTWQPPSFSKKKSDMDGRETDALPSPKSRTADASMMSGKGSWTPPNSRKNTEPSGGHKDAGRKTPLLESINESSPRFPKPSPRHKSQQSDTDESPRSTGERPKPIPRGRFSKTKEGPEKQAKERPKSRGSPTDIFGKGRQSPMDDIFGKGRKTPVDELYSKGRKTPVEEGVFGKGRRSPVKEEEKSESRFGQSSYRKGKESPRFGRKALSKDEEDEDERKSPVDRRRKSVLDFMDSEKSQNKEKSRNRLSKADSRDSISDELEKGRKSPLTGMKGRKSPYADREDKKNSYADREDRKSPYVEREGRKSPYAERDNRKNPYADREGRKSPHADEMTRKWNSSSRRRRGEESEEDSDEDESSPYRGDPRLDRTRTMPERRLDKQDGKPRLDHSHTLPATRTAPGMSEREGGVERASSVCEDVEEDPTMRIPETQEAKELKKKAPTVQRKEKQILDNAIDSIAGAQDRTRTMQFIDPDKQDQKNDRTTEVHAAKLPKHRPKPRYVTPPVKEPTTQTFNSSTDIRQAVFDEWKKERMEQAKKDLIERKKKEKLEEEKKKKDKEDKIFEAKASYNAWMEGKKETEKDKIQRKRKEAEKERKKLEEQQEKKKDAEHSFKSWKSNKDVYLKEKDREKKREEEKKLREEREIKQQKKKDSQSSFTGWKSRKEIVMLKKMNEEKRQKEKEERAEKEKQKEREKEALKSYREWERKKEEREQMMLEEKRRSRTMVDYNESEARPAWSPASRTIPFGR